MKTNSALTRTALGLSLLTLVMTFTATAAQPATTAKGEKNFTGMIVTVDPKEHTLGVKGFVVSKTFNLGDSCLFTLWNRNAGTLADLRPGQKVTVAYQNANGVLVASQVDQQPLVHEGTVKIMSPDQHELTLHLRGWDKKFALGDDCAVRLRDNKIGTLADIKPGHFVKVIYETPGGAATVRQIIQTSATYAGSLSAIDASEHTIKIKHLLGVTKFNLADGCVIVVNGKPEGQLSDLRLGDPLTLSYDTVNGVNVVNRIAKGEATEQTMAAQPEP